MLLALGARAATPFDAGRTLTSEPRPQGWVLRYDGANYTLPTESNDTTGVRCVR
jgi:hypothetical protein